MTKKEQEEIHSKLVRVWWWPFKVNTRDPLVAWYLRRKDRT